LIGRKDVAEDLTQELWLRLTARAWTLREDTRLGPWLFTVARNLCVSFWRSRGEFEPAINVDIELLEMPGSNPRTLPRATEAEELRQRIERALAALPVRYREVLVLIGVEGISPADAAVVCGIKPEALRKRLERARKMFAEKLGMERGA
jgi:RNA polymerase sigma-70 factor (ECF subfamily)